MATCSRCGGEMAPGALYSAVRTSFRPQDSKFLTLQTGDVMTKAQMCRQCGLIEIIGDIHKLRHLTSAPDPCAYRTSNGRALYRDRSCGSTDRFVAFLRAQPPFTVLTGPRGLVSQIVLPCSVFARPPCPSWWYGT